MMKTILAKHFLRFFTLLVSLLLLMTTSPVDADSGSNGDNIDPGKTMLLSHMELMRQGNPEIDGKVNQVQEKLNAGVPVMECCSDCHVEGGMGP